MTSSTVLLAPGGTAARPARHSLLAGLAAGLRQEGGVDLGAARPDRGHLGECDRRAILASGDDPARLAAPPTLPDPGGVRTDRRRLAEVLAVLGDPRLSRAEAVRRVGRLAASTSTGEQEAAISRMHVLAGPAEWPDRPLLTPSVDAGTAQAMTWDRHGAASPPEALPAGTAFPATRAADHH